MTITQTERVDYSQGPARIDTQSSSYAQFPAASQLPKAAADAIEPFLTLRARRADAASAYGEAIAALEKAKLADAEALLDHVRAGGTASEFRDTATVAAKDVAYAGGGNLLPEMLEEYGTKLAEAAASSAKLNELQRTVEADELWRESYAGLRRARPDGPVAQILARCAPQVLRLALAYALTDCAEAIGYDHLRAALAVWSYVEATAEWLFSVELDTGEVDALVAFIAATGNPGCTRTEISVGHFKRNRPAAEIDGMLGELLRDGRIRQDTDRSKPGRPVVRYFPC